MRELKEIREILNLNSITGYKIWKDTKGMITEAGVNRVLDGTSINPRKSTLHILSNYIDDFLDSDSNKMDSNKETEFFTSNICETKNNLSKKDLKAFLYILTHYQEVYSKTETYRLFEEIIRLDERSAVKKEYMAKKIALEKLKLQESQSTISNKDFKVSKS